MKNPLLCFQRFTTPSRKHGLEAENRNSKFDAGRLSTGPYLPAESGDQTTDSEFRSSNSGLFYDPDVEDGRHRVVIDGGEDEPALPLANRDSEGASGGRISLKFCHEIPTVREFHHLAHLLGIRVHTRSIALRRNEVAVRR